MSDESTEHKSHKQRGVGICCHWHIISSWRPVYYWSHCRYCLDGVSGNWEIGNIYYSPPLLQYQLNRLPKQVQFWPRQDYTDEDSDFPGMRILLLWINETPITRIQSGSWAILTVRGSWVTLTVRGRSWALLTPSHHDTNHYMGHPELQIELPSLIRFRCYWIYIWRNVLSVSTNSDFLRRGVKL